GGDIAPVEPVVETPAPAASGWEFSGTAKVYYQTHDFGGDLFEQETSAADFGLQLRATNADVVAGIGAGVEVSGLSTLNLENWMVSNVMQSVGNVYGIYDIDEATDGGWISQMYLTYGFGNTSIKAGRQELPKALSPFAFSEDWNVWKNTFDAVLIVNTDIQDTTLVGAYVGGANYNGFGVLGGLSGYPLNITNFDNINSNSGAYMLTVQNKSIENLTLTGSWYYLPDDAYPEDINILWGDAQYDAGMFNVAIQGGAVMSDMFNDDTTAFGAKVGGSVSGINLMAAYATTSNDDHGGFAIQQLGGQTSALYTETVVDQIGQKWGGYTRSNMDKFVVGANADVLGGNLGAVYSYNEFTPWGYTTHKVDEFDVVYSANVTDSINVTAAYVYANDDSNTGNDNFDSNNIVRVIGTYNF
ncbi:MAG: hypothetical protein IE920_10345, partial [Thiotrichales bacterium]|nr:hypothetical protein [Thiotrichales bacterium]